MAFPTYAKLESIIKGHRWDVDSTGDYDCVDVAKKVDSLYFPGVGWRKTGIHGNGKDIFNNANPQYYLKVHNDVNNAKQLPKPGDIICFYPTPRAGYSNKYKNPYGHVALFKSSSGGKLTILMQSSGTGKAAWLDTHSWKYRPCIGWLRPIPQKASKPPVPTVPKAELDEATKTVAAQKKQIDTLSAQVKALTTENTSLKAQVGDATRWQTLRTLLRELLGLNK